MLHLLSIMVLSASMNAMPVNALCEANEYAPIKVEAEQGEQIVEAYYISNGLNSILIKVMPINGRLYVTAYCSGRDYKGNQNWESIARVEATRYYGGRAVSSNSEINRALYQMNRTAKIGDTTIYFKY